jgi:1-acyl-sn-glycerol-3-phosphate acyltransferase
MQYMRSKLFDALLVGWTLLLGAFIPILMLVQSPNAVRYVSRLWSRGIIWGLRYIVGLTFAELNKERVPQGPKLFVCNHQSSWETLVFNVLIPDVAIVLKESLYRYPIVGWYLKYSPMIPLDRSAGAKALRNMCNEAKAAIDAGRSVLIFPEGTRTPIDETRKFNRGVELLYKQLDVTVVPIAINSGVFWSPVGFMKYAGNITVSYLEPIPPGRNSKKVFEHIETEINQEKVRLVKSLDIDTWLEALE